MILKYLVAKINKTCRFPFSVHTHLLMKLIPVDHPHLARRFLHLPLTLYKNDPNFIRPLDKDVELVFDKLKNKNFRNGDCKRWILENEKGETIGRVAAFFNKKVSASFEQPTGGMGFFECINHREAAFVLFDAAKNWLSQHGMEAMDGPVNFGDRDRWWGLLADGFYPPCYCCNYNPPYYLDFFEAYGFKLYFKQYTYYRRVHNELRPAYFEKAKRILDQPEYSFEYLKKRQMAKFTEDFRSVYNKAWVKHTGVREMSALQAKQIMDKLKPVIDGRIAWFAYYHNEPVGFFISIPELNQLFVKDVNGKLDLIGKIRFLWNKFLNKCKTMHGIAFGVVPEHQRKGVEIAMIVAASRVLQDKRKVPYTELQMNWIGDFNPKMMNVAEHIGGRIYKTHHTYRYLFDREKEFKRHPMIG